MNLEKTVEIERLKIRNYILEKENKILLETILELSYQKEALTKNANASFFGRVKNKIKNIIKRIIGR